MFRTFFLAVEFEKEHSRKSEKGAEGKMGKSLQKNGESKFCKNTATFQPLEPLYSQHDILHKWQALVVIGGNMERIFFT